MKLSDPKALTRRGHLVRQIVKEEWPMRLGDWRAVGERCDLLADTAPTEAGIRHWSANSVKALLYREGLIGYDTDAGLWYCCVVAPKQDYPDGWQSDALVERKKRQAEREAERNLVADLRAEVNSGSTFAKALARHPGEFSGIFVAVVGAGEQSGSLGAVLEHLANDLEDQQALNAKLLGAALYPAVVSMVALGIFFGGWIGYAWFASRLAGWCSARF